MRNPELEIERSLSRLEDAMEELEKYGDEAANAEVEFKAAFSQERLKAKARAKTTDKQADDEATVATEELQLAYKISQNRFATQREVVRAIEARLSALQTVSAGYRRV